MEDDDTKDYPLINDLETELSELNARKLVANLHSKLDYLDTQISAHF